MPPFVNLSFLHSDLCWRQINKTLPHSKQYYLGIIMDSCETLQRCLITTLVLEVGWNYICIANHSTWHIYLGYCIEINQSWMNLHVLKKVWKHHLVCANLFYLTINVDNNKEKNIQITALSALTWISNCVWEILNLYVLLSDVSFVNNNWINLVSKLNVPVPCGRILFTVVSYLR